MEATAQAASSAVRGQTMTARLPLWVLLGALLGILVGITFGERTAVLRPLGDVYTMMLLSVVYPYILSSLIVGLGSLATGRAWRLLQASWGIYLFLWVAVFAAIFVLAQAIPPPAPPVEIKPPHPISVLALLQTIVPDNLTHALSQNFVPAIVVFAVASVACCRRRRVHQRHSGWPLAADRRRGNARWNSRSQDPSGRLRAGGDTIHL
jgi:Na+/H+-dicarboxylate symporter